MPPSLVRYWLASLIVCLAPSAFAEGRRVQVLSPPAELASLRTLVEAELRAAGLQVVSEDPVAAVVRLAAAPRRVSVWTARDLRLRTYATDPREPDGADEALARQVAEVLRAELTLGSTGSEPPPPARPVPPPTVHAPSPPPDSSPPPWPASSPLHGTAPPVPAPWGGVAVAPTVLLSPGPLPPVGQVLVEFRAHPWRGLETAAFAALPMAASTATDETGDLVATTGQVGIHVGYDLLAGSPWSLAPQVGVGWQWLQLTGRANPPFRSGRASGHLGWLFTGAVLRYAATPWLSVLVGGRIGVLVPRVTLAVDESAIGGFGWPGVQAYGGLDLPLRGPLW